MTTVEMFLALYKLNWFSSSFVRSTLYLDPIPCTNKLTILALSISEGITKFFSINFTQLWVVIHRSLYISCCRSESKHSARYADFESFWPAPIAIFLTLCQFDNCRSRFGKKIAITTFLLMSIWTWNMNNDEGIWSTRRMMFFHTFFTSERNRAKNKRGTDDVYYQETPFLRISTYDMYENFAASRRVGRTCRPGNRYESPNFNLFFI